MRIKPAAYITACTTTQIGFKGNDNKDKLISDYERHIDFLYGNIRTLSAEAATLKSEKVGLKKDIGIFLDILDQRDLDKKNHDRRIKELHRILQRLLNEMEKAGLPLSQELIKELDGMLNH